jgi:exopolyphosphatase/guanosine-5'-triphosphate,3'-diphosphate pyrophosphatase
MARKLAVVDVGSNTVRLVVARARDSRLEPTHSEKVRLGLGREVEEEGALSEEAIAETATAVCELVATARGKGAEHVEILVTAPGRQAENGDQLAAAIEAAARLRVRVLSGDDEARLAFTGAVGAAPAGARVVAVVDLGGASTEIAIGMPDTGPSWLRSVDLGVVRLFHGLLDADEPDLEAARAVVAEAFADVVPPLPQAALAVGGSARALRRVAGPRLGPGELAAATRLAATNTPGQLADEFGVGKRRAPLLLAAALILGEVQQRLLVPLEVVDGGLREGALLAALEDAAAA